MKRRIALILPVEFEYPLRLSAGATGYALDHPEVELTEVAYRYGAKDPLVDRAIDFEGAIIWAERGDDWVRNLVDAGVSVVSTNGEWPEEMMPCVGFAASAATEAATAHLLGLARALYIGWQIAGTVMYENLKDRFLQRCREAGTVAACYETGRFPGMADSSLPIPREAQERLSAFLGKQSYPAVAWCEDDRLARLVCTVAAETSIGVPTDLAVLGMGDLRSATVGRPMISTIAVPGELIGHRAAQVADDLIRGKPLASRLIVLRNPPVIVRESTVPAGSGDGVLDQAHRWIERHACDGGTVNELMQSMPVSQRTLSKLFVEKFALTPGQEIRRVRLQRAQQYLRGTDLTIQRIGQLCGYNQAAKFSNFFRRETGTSPSAYRDGDTQPLEPT